MNGITKILTLILGAVAVLACLATVGIIGYSAVNGGGSASETGAVVSYGTDEEGGTLELVPVMTPEPSPDVTATPEPVDTVIGTEHVHDYKETVIKAATCTEAGQIMYSCSCGDTYYVDILSLGHAADDEWEIVRAATDTENGLRVKRCVRCGEILASETIPMTGTTVSADGTKVSEAPHEHLYVSTIEREPTCTLAGLRKHTCSCGDFYTETIPALGHVASDWEEAEAPTVTQLGTSQRTCKVCGALLDTKVIPKLTPSPAASSSPGASSAASSTAAKSSSSPGASAKPSPTPHVHSYASYIITAATCTEKGVRSYVCSGCGSSYAESIELDLNNHKFMATFVAPTETQQGYTVYTCLRCNYSYMDNYIMPLGGGTGSTVTTANATPTPAASSGS